MSQVICFLLGMAVYAAFSYFGTHPEDRDALFSRIRGLFK